MTMTEKARQLAAQMTAAGITPGNVENHPAFMDSGGLHLLRYAIDNNGVPQLGAWACTLHRKGDDWLLWDAHGARSKTITHRAGAWQVA